MKRTVRAYDQGKASLQARKEVMPSNATTPRRRGGRRSEATPVLPEWLTSLPGAVSTAVLGKFDLDVLQAGYDKVRADVNNEYAAWLRTAKDLADWREKFLRQDLSIADHFEPVAAAWLGRGVGTVRAYLSGRTVAHNTGITYMSKEAMSSVAKYDADTQKAILEESGGDIGKIREIKARMATEAAAQDPEAAAKAALSKANRVKGFVKAFDSDVREAIGTALLSGEPVDTVALAEAFVEGFRQGTMRMAPKTGLTRAEEMTAGVQSIVNTLHEEHAVRVEAEAEAQ